MATRHRLQKFLLRHGHLYPGAGWTLAYWKWLRALQLGSALLHQTFERYMASLLDQQERLRAMDADIREMASSPRYAPRVRRRISWPFWDWCRRSAPAARSGCKAGSPNRATPT
jgi:hypothetical protein